MLSIEDEYFGGSAEGWSMCMAVFDVINDDYVLRISQKVRKLRCRSITPRTKYTTSNYTCAVHSILR